jgi:DNA polymerase-1
VVRPHNPDHVILVIDLDQIEMREHAEQSGCPEMIRIFNANEDIHSNTARYCFDVAKGQEKSNIPGLSGNELTYRQASKTLGFLLLFRGEAKGFANKIGESGLLLTQTRAEEIREGWLDLYHGTREFWAECDASLKSTGHSRSPLGRIRYLPQVWSPEEYMAAEACRQGTNLKIQCGAQEKLKTGAARVYKILPRWRRRGFVEPLLTIHDELDFEIHKDIAEEFAQEAIRLMTDFDGKVEVKAKHAIAPSWGEIDK